MVAGIAWFVEDFNLIQPGTAFKIITKIIIFIPFFMVFPYLWDLYAITIENSAFFLIDPFNESDPSTRTQELWRSMGAIIPQDMFDVGAWGAALADPGTAGQALVKNVFLALFKGIAVMMMTVMMFVIICSTSCTNFCFDNCITVNTCNEFNSIFQKSNNSTY